jgi:hypothetical protein
MNYWTRNRRIYVTYDVKLGADLIVKRGVDIKSYNEFL